MTTDESEDVILLRSADDPDPYIHAFEDVGLTAVCQPVLRFVFPYNDALKDRLRQRDQYGGVVATSPRAARALELAFDDTDVPRTQWENVPAYVVGPKTAAKFHELGFNVRGQNTGNAGALASWIADTDSTGRLLFLSGNRRRDTLPDKLDEKNVSFDEQVVYKTEIRSDVSLPSPEGDPWLVFFSPSGVKAMRRSGASIDSYRCAAIGPTTAGILREQSVPVAAVADSPSPEGVVSAIESA